MECDWQIVDDVGQHREGQFVGHSIDRIAQHTQWLTRSERWRRLGRWLGIRVRTPDHLGGVRKQFPGGIENRSFFFR